MFATIVILLSFSFFSACTTVPVTGRHQLALIPNSQLLPSSFQNYQEMLKTKKLSANSQQVNQVRRVGNKIQKAVEEYMNQNQLGPRLAGYQWEFNLLEDPTPNAWALPGGKVAFHTGILPICQNETGIAVVMGHEVAHAIAEHGNERLTQGLLVQMGGMGLALALREKPKQTQELLFMAYGLSTTVGAVLPFSRLQESEADRLGLIFMALAGYDPRQAPDFWMRMQEKSGGGAPPEFLSTHPSSSSRRKNLQALIPEALKYYRPGN